jgi:signal transduction histidine kinase
MTFASDQKHDWQLLSATSRRMLALRDAVFAEWEERVRATIPDASALQHPILIDTLPAYYDNIAEAVTAAYPRLTAAGGTSLAAEHGGERARITAYDHQALISEYQIFRWVIFDVLYREGVHLEPSEVLTINASVDAAIKDAVQGFALVGSALRERFAAALAHDLRGPLTAAMLMLDLAGLIDDPAELKKLSKKAANSLSRVDRMIHELLDTMKFHSGTSLSLDLSNFDITEVVKEVQAEKMAAQGLRIILTGQAVTGWWDRGAMKRAVENIVGNAIKYGTHERPITAFRSQRRATDPARRTGRHFPDVPPGRRDREKRARLGYRPALRARRGRKPRRQYRAGQQPRAGHDIHHRRPCRLPAVQGCPQPRIVRPIDHAGRPPGGAGRCREFDGRRCAAHGRRRAVFSQMA